MRLLITSHAAPQEVRRLLRTHWAFDHRSFVRLFNAVFRQKVLLALLALDALLIGVHVVIIGLTPNEDLAAWKSWFRLGVDRGVGEIFEYLQLGIASILLLAVAVRRSPVLVPMSLLILYLVLDNAFRVHEHLGTLLMPNHQNRGELAAFAGLGAIIASIAAFTYVRASQRERADILAVAVGILLVGGTAAGVDAIRALLVGRSLLFSRTMLIVEDGGELIAQSVLLVICVVIWKLGR